MAYDITWEPQGVYKKYTGHVTGEEFVAAVERVNAHPAFDSFRYVVNDFTDCMSFKIDPALQDAAVAAALGAQCSNPNFVAAFVATHPPLLQALEKMVESAQGGMTVCVFQQLDDARHWASTQAGLH